MLYKRCTDKFRKIQRKTPLSESVFRTQAFSCEFYKNFKNTFITEHLRCLSMWFPTKISNHNLSLTDIGYKILQLLQAFVDTITSFFLGILKIIIENFKTKSEKSLHYQNKFCQSLLKVLIKLLSMQQMMILTRDMSHFHNTNVNWTEKMAVQRITKFHDYFCNGKCSWFKGYNILGYKCLLKLIKRLERVFSNQYVTILELHQTIKFNKLIY